MEHWLFIIRRWIHNGAMGTVKNQWQNGNQKNFYL